MWMRAKTTRAGMPRFWQRIQVDMYMFATCNAHDFFILGILWVSEPGFDFRRKMVCFDTILQGCFPQEVWPQGFLR